MDKNEKNNLTKVILFYDVNRHYDLQATCFQISSTKRITRIPNLKSFPWLNLAKNCYR